MSRVLIEVTGGVVSYVASDDSSVDIYLRDFDDLKERGLKHGPAEQIGCTDISSEDMDEAL